MLFSSIALSILCNEASADDVATKGIRAIVKAVCVCVYLYVYVRARV